MDKKNNLTTVSNWDEDWNDIKLPSMVNMDSAFDRCLVNSIKNNLPKLDGDILEIGCAPGKWLSFFFKEYNLNIHGIEYSNFGFNKTLKNFEFLKINDSKIYNEDFFEIEPSKKFDVVISLGFIEHFVDVDDVIRRHLDWIKPNGFLIIGVPNFSGIYKPIQYLLNKEILFKHNLTIMNLEFFKKIDNKFELKNIFTNYIGSFDPTLFVLNKNIKFHPLQIFFRCIFFILRRLRKIKYFDNFNNKYYSSYILSIKQKTE